MQTYTAYKSTLNGSLTNKAPLNNVDELNDWINSQLGKAANILIIRDGDGKKINMTDAGGYFEKV